MSSNRKLTSTAAILTLTAGLLVNPQAVQTMLNLLTAEQDRRKNYEKEVKKLTNDIFKQNIRAQDQVIDRTPAHTETRQPQHVIQGNSRRR